MKTFPPESLDCIVTSPPYWGLRDYGVRGQLGLEQTAEEYVHKLCAVFDEVKRVLKTSGTCWVNLGDTYASNTKSLVLIPFRFAIEMVKRGWRLRNVIIWHKPNAIPASVKDRFTVDFEYLFFFTKSGNYFFHQQFEPHAPSTRKRVQRFRENKEHFDPKRHKFNPAPGAQFPFKILQNISRKGLNPKGRNKRCVWTIGTRNFHGPHFAVYPEQLIETPIKAGCPKDGVVCDPFFGTGTTGLTARRLHRHFVGIELNSKYVRLARKRLALHSEDG